MPESRLCHWVFLRSSKSEFRTFWGIDSGFWGVLVACPKWCLVYDARAVTMSAWGWQWSVLKKGSPSFPVASARTSKASAEHQRLLFEVAKSMHRLEKTFSPSARAFREKALALGDLHDGSKNGISWAKAAQAPVYILQHPRSQS